MARAKKTAVPFRDFFYGAMLFIVTGIMPLLVRAYKIISSPEVQAVFGYEEYYDHLSYLKSWFVIIPAGLIVFYFISELATGGIKNIGFKKIITSPMIIAVLVFLIMASLSAALSEYKHTAVFGTYERFEGIIMLFSYMVVFITAFFYLREEKYIQPVLAGLIFSSLIMGAIGFAKFLGLDFFTTELAKFLITTEDAPSFTVEFEIAFATLYNPNTYGLYSAMMFPFLLMCGFAYEGKKWIKALLILAGLLMLGGVPASNSLGGLMGAVTAVAVLAVTYAANLVYNKKIPTKAVGLSLLAAAAAFAAVLLLVPPVRARMAGFADKFMLSMTMGGDEQLPNYRTDGNKFIIEGEDGAARAVLEFGETPWLTIRDGAGNEVPPSGIVYNNDATEADRNDANPYNATLNYNVPGYGRLDLIRARSAMAIVFANYGDNNRMLLSYSGGAVTALLRDGTPVDINEPVESFGFEGREKWATMRGYIWSRSLPLLLKYPVIGSGPDTFAYVFPQHDVVGKLRMYNLPYIAVDKAHNIYMQTWITTGGISALALIFLFGAYLVGAFVSLMKAKGEDRFTFCLRLGLLAGIAAFCVSSLSTDSTVGSSGVFYVLLGLGYASNAWTKTLSAVSAKAGR